MTHVPVYKRMLWRGAEWEALLPGWRPGTSRDGHPVLPLQLELPFLGADLVASSHAGFQSPDPGTSVDGEGPRAAPLCRLCGPFSSWEFTRLLAGFHPPG